MKQLDTTEHMNAYLSVSLQKEAVVLLAEAQLDGLEKILESAPGLVESVLSYNQLAVNINKLRYLIRGAYFGLTTDSVEPRLTETEPFRSVEE